MILGSRLPEGWVLRSEHPTISGASPVAFGFIYLEYVAHAKTSVLLGLEAR